MMMTIEFNAGAACWLIQAKARMERLLATMTAILLAHCARSTASHKGVRVVCCHLIPSRCRRIAVTQRYWPNHSVPQTTGPMNMRSPLLLLTTPLLAPYLFRATRSRAVLRSASRVLESPWFSSALRVLKQRENCDFRGLIAHALNEDLFRSPNPFKTAMTPSASDCGTYMRGIPIQHPPADINRCGNKRSPRFWSDVFPG